MKSVDLPMENSIFVGREAELVHLKDLWDRALAGQGGICLLAGDAGSGKTILFQAFVKRTQAEYQDVLAAAGNCNAAAGFGDPYLPFRELLGMLTGDIHRHRKVGGPENSRRLNSFFHLAIETLV